MPFRAVIVYIASYSYIANRSIDDTVYDWRNSVSLNLFNNWFSRQLATGDT